MTDARSEFLAGERHDDVVFYVSDRVLDDPEPLLEYGERVVGADSASEGSEGSSDERSESDGGRRSGKTPTSSDERSESDGVLLVMDGETGRSVFQSATEMDAMAFAGKAMKTEGQIDRDLTGSTCPKADSDADEDDADADPDAEHETRFVFAFSEEENPEVGGRYDDGDVIHAYAHCSCGAAYSQNWTVGERADDAAD